MKITRAKVGTHAATVIYVVEGELRLGSYIRWVDDPKHVKLGPQHRHGGIIDRIDEDGLIFVERM